MSIEVGDLFCSSNQIAKPYTQCALQGVDKNSAQEMDNIESFGSYFQKLCSLRRFPVGNVNSRSRYYSPTLQRFISEDPLGMAGSGPNLYAYAGDDPVNFTDSSGLSRDCFNTGCGGLPGPKPTAGRKDRTT